MGFERSQSFVKDLTLWEKYADQFPVRENLIYLNHAAVSPLCKPSADAMKHLADDGLNFGSLHYDEWMAAYEGVRRAAARLINSDPSEIALMKNTSEGIATIAMGLDWKPGDRVVAFREEFPANYYPWKRLEARGVQVTWLSVEDSLDRIDEACRGARLLSISFVQFLSGYRAPVPAIGEICHRNHCIYMVDAIQGMGAFPLDVRASHIDALADYGSRDMALRPDAGRYEPGTLNTIGCFGLRASLEFILEVGVREIAPVVQNLGDRIAAGVQAKGYEVLGNRTPDTGAGIVSFRKAGFEDTGLVRQLRAAGIAAAPRTGWVRTSPHFYISPADIDRMLEVLP
jgi:cysteine desulfurase/selenocysteine lyase